MPPRDALPRMPTPSSTPMPSNTVARRAALTNLISRLRTPWVRTFLLETHPSDAASLLTSPLQRLHSLSWSAETRVNRLTDPVPAVPSTVSSTVMIPAFSRDGLTACTRVEESVGRTPPGPFMAAGFSQGRLVLSEDDGSIISAVPHENTSGAVTLYAKQVPSGREQVMQAFVFDAEMLRALLERDATDGEEAEGALHAAVFLRNLRACAVCGRHAHEACGCKLSFGRSQHALDFSKVRDNLAASLGNYHGFGIMERLARGRVQRVTAVGTTWSGVSDASYGVTNRLLSWAIAQSLAASVPTVFRPIGLLEIPEKAAAVAVGDYPDHARADVDPLDGFDPAVATFDFSELDKSALYETGAVELMSDLPFAGDVFENTDGSGSTGQAAARMQSTSTDPLESVVPEVLADLAVTHRQVTLTPDVTNATDAVVQITECGCQRVSASPNVTSLLPRAKAVPIAPLPPHVNHEREAAPALTMLEMKKLRAHQQKLRNRESAARSNLARKKRREMLKLQQAA